MNAIIERLSHPTTEDLRELREIYEANFPLSERKPFSHFPSRIASDEYFCMVARSEAAGGRAIGVALLMMLPQSQLAFLEYLAVAEPLQRRGIGSALIRCTAEHVRVRALGKGLVWEVEPPGNDAFGASARRIRFYERLGGRLLRDSETYAMPNFRLGHGGVPLRLMQLPLQEEPSTAELARTISEIYRVAYPEWLSLRDEILLTLGDSQEISRVDTVVDFSRGQLP